MFILKKCYRLPWSYWIEICTFLCLQSVYLKFEYIYDAVRYFYYLESYFNDKQ